MSHIFNKAARMDIHPGGSFLFGCYPIHVLCRDYYSNVIDRSVRAIPSVPISRSAGRK